MVMRRQLWSTVMNMHSQTRIQDQKYNGAQKSQSPGKNMQGLSAAFFLAQKVGEKLG